MKRIFVAALTALCALLPVVALAQAGITEEAVYAWQIERSESEQDTYLELMEAFDSPEWDGTTVVSLAGGESQGAASVERDGGYVLALLQKDDGGWSVSQVNETLLDMPELPALYDAEVSSGSPWTFQIRPDDDFSDMVWIACEDGKLTLKEIDMQNMSTVQSFVPEIRNVKLETAYIIVCPEDGGLFLDLYAEDTKMNIVLEDRVAVDPAQFDLSRMGLSEIFARAGRYAAQRNEPTFIMSDGSAYALPQPQLAKFKKSGKYDVYTGPGTQYVRESNGKASVSTNGWIQVFGEENGWLLVQYNVKEGRNRFGYIKATPQAAGVSVPTLSWKNEAATYDGGLRFTDDPLRSFEEVGVDYPATGDCRLLATLGGFCYIETVTPQGKPMRTFVQREAFEP